MAAPAERKCLTDPIKEERPVGQAGQGVVEDDLAELILECPALRDVPDREHEPADICVAQEADNGGLGAQPSTSTAPQADVLRQGRPRKVSRFGQEGLHPGPLLRKHKIGERRPGQVPRAAPQHPPHRARRIDDAQVAADDDDHVGGMG